MNLKFTIFYTKLTMPIILLLGNSNFFCYGRGFVLAYCMAYALRNDSADALQKGDAVTTLCADKNGNNS
jgi:hypothetical protein